MTAPTATAVSPAVGEILLARTLPIVIDIVEPTDGVNTATIAVTVNGVSAYSANAFHNSWTGSLMGRPQGGYRLVLNNPVAFTKNQPVTVTVDAASNTADPMLQLVYVFFIQIEQITSTEDVTVPRIVDTGPSQLTGTVSVTQSSTTVTGSGTSFLTELVVGDGIKFGVDPTLYIVLSITDNTNLTLTSPFSGTTAGVVAAYRIFLWIGYSREPGNIILRRTQGNGLTSEVIVVPGDDLSVSFDPTINKFLLTYVHNGKVFLTTAAVTDMPETLVQTSILRNAVKLSAVGDSPSAADGIPGIVTYEPIKMVPPIETYSTQFYGDSAFPTLSEYPKFPSDAFRSFPYASSAMSAVPNLPGTSATWRITGPSGIDAAYKIGFNLIKVMGGSPGEPLFVPFSTTIPEYVEFTETAAPLNQSDAYYCLQTVIRDPSGKVLAGPIHGYYKHPTPPAFGVPDTISAQFIGSADVTADGIPTIVTFEPLKLVPPADSYSMQLYGDSAYLTLQTTGYGNVGVG